ncbi:MAG TPA: phosphoenolpyruvate carboxylase, partial [Candidatus Limnocylindrales bacterium]|nr:phosphoenolpyruvate carboxylase [Candidatus Limnocylindrales bacterium]
MPRSADANTGRPDARPPGAGTHAASATKPVAGAGTHAAGDANEAVRAEPATIGTGRARDPLALEIRLLGSLLGQVIAEQAGRDLLDLVERVRRTTIRLRRGDDPALRAGLVAELAALDPDRAEVVVRAFSLY